MNTMKLALATATLVAAALTPVAEAADWPTKPVMIYVLYSDGGSIDAMARPIAAKLSQMWGQPVLVDNKPGANGILAIQTLMKAPADGHTLLYHITGVVQNPWLYKSARYDPNKDLAPLVQIGGQAMGLAVPAKSDFKTVDQLVAAGRATKDGQTFGSVGNGHTGHVWSELLAAENGFKATHVAYKGSGPLTIDLISGRLDWAFLSTAEAVVRASDQSVRILAVSGPERVKQLAGVPTLKEAGFKGFEMVGWHGIFAPAGTPAPVRKKIEDDLRKVLADPEIVKLADTQVITITGLGQDDFARVVRTDYERWGSLMRKFDIKND